MFICLLNHPGIQKVIVHCKNIMVNYKMEVNSFKVSIIKTSMFLTKQAVSSDRFSPDMPWYFLIKARLGRALGDMV